MCSPGILLHPICKVGLSETVRRCPSKKNLFYAEVHLLTDNAAAVFSSPLVANSHLQSVVIGLKLEEPNGPAGDDASWRAILRRDHRPRLALVHDLAALQDSGAYLEL